MSIIDEPTASYAEIVRDAYGTFVDALEAANARSIGYVRSALGIVGRPFASTAVDVVVADGAMRASALVSLSLDAVSENNRVAAELAREAARIAASAGETYVGSLRGVADATVSNLAFVKRAAERLQSQDLQSPHFN